MGRLVATLDPGLVAVLVIAGFFLVWYFIGGSRNRRLARRLANEIRDCLLAWGGTSKVQVFGATAFRMTTEDANPPFREVSVVVTLQPREMPINWALARAQGRRDIAVLEASLRQSPRVGFEIVDPSSRVGKRRVQAKSSWSTTSLGGKEYLISSKNERTAQDLLRSSGKDVLASVAALHVTAGSEPGMAASLSLEAGKVGSVFAGLHDLANAVLA